MKLNDNTFLILVFLFLLPFFFEWWGARNLKLKIYSLGPLVFSFKEPWTKVFFPSNEIKETHSSRFKVIQPNHILFQYKNPSPLRNSRSSYPLKGSILISGSTATISARGPVVMTIFTILCVLGVSILGIRIIKNQSLYQGLLILLGGWLVIYVIARLNFNFEKKRLLGALEEIKKYDT